MDALVPGLYIWFGPLVALRRRSLLGTQAKPEAEARGKQGRRRGTIHSSTGIALVLPGYRIYTTYQGSYDPR
jgi:hypothetical protein